MTEATDLRDITIFHYKNTEKADEIANFLSNKLIILECIAGLNDMIKVALFVLVNQQ